MIGVTLLLLGCWSRFSWATGMAWNHREFVAQAAAAPEESFYTWSQAFEKVYTNTRERQQRYQVWLANLQYAHAHNSQNASYWLGLNGFADLTNEEFRQRYTSGPVPHPNQAARGGRDYIYAGVEPPEAMDWRRRGAVTRVKDQKECASGYAFAAVGAMEGILAILTGRLINLSEQQVVDCSRFTWNQGCNGGTLGAAFDFIAQAGITKEAHYPYRGSEGNCKGLVSLSAMIDGFVEVPAADEHALMQAVSRQPVATAIRTATLDFQLYAGGVLDIWHCGLTLDHSVLLAGYGQEGGQQYWLAKNSFGASWGEEGYLRIRRGAGGQGTCGTAMAAMFPI